MYPQAHECPACLKPSDARGYHALTCLKWGGLIHRHHALANVVASTGVSAHHQPRREAAVVSGSRPADVLFPHWHLGKPLALDFAVTHPQQPSNRQLAGVATPGSWATEYAKTHKEAGARACAAVGIDFAPMVVETFGAWSPQALDVLKALAHQYSIHQGVPEPIARATLFTKLSVTLQRQNARMLLARSVLRYNAEAPLPDAPNDFADVDGDSDAEDSPPSAEF